MVHEIPFNPIILEFSMKSCPKDHIELAARALAAETGASEQGLEG